MIIPIRCFSCNNVIADKWHYYKREIAKVRGTGKAHPIDGTIIPQSLELELMKRLGLNRPCCRKQFLTHVDLMEKI
jgi:DNA-directed RNA polymerase I, II, and III subunit RPABC5